MIKFDNNELEIALVTYNRPDFVEEYYDITYSGFIDRNIMLSIYDSSTNSNTERIIKKYGNNIKYHKVPPDIEIGYKPMFPILNSRCKYLWVACDSKYFKFDDLDNRVFTKIKENIDSVIIGVGPRYLDTEVYYRDKSKFLIDCFISTTCIGHSIYKTSIFDELKNNYSFKNYLDKKYKNNYGFAWLGYFYESFALNNNVAVYEDFDGIAILPNKKKQSWVKRFYECWIENVIDITFKLPSSYRSKNDVPRFVWEKMKLDTFEYCYIAKMSNGLSFNIYKKYESNGMLEIVAANKFKLLICSILPNPLLSLVYILKKIHKKLFKLFNLVVFCFSINKCKS